MCALLAVTSLATFARATIAPAFAGKVNVDATFITGAALATDIAFAADGRAIVTRKTGEILVRRPSGTTSTIAYPFGGTLDTNSEKGLLGVVADPRVAANPAFFFYVSNGPVEDKHRVYRAVLTPADTLLVDAVPVLAASRGVGPGLEGPVNHDGGGVVVHGGQLYIAVGDTGANATPPVNKYGSCLNKGNGKILRVNLDGSIPSDNPLASLGSVTACSTPTGPWTMAPPDPRIFDWGLRNPWRFWIDAPTGLLWIGDVGEATEEEVAVAQPGQHHGYPFVEGSRAWGNVEGMNCASMTPSRSCTAPVFSYGHSVGQAITGGLIPEGCGWSKVFDAPHYVFADSSAGWVRALRVDANRTGIVGPAIDFDTGAGSPVSIRMGPDGAMYVVSNGGTVYRYAPVDRTGVDCPVAVPVMSRGAMAWLGALLAMVGSVGAALLRRARRKDATAWVSAR